MYLSDAVDALATSLNTGRGRLDTLARRLQEGGQLPKSEGGSNRPVVTIDHVVSLLFAHIVGVGYGHVAKAVEDIRNYRNDETTAGDFVAAMLQRLVDLDTGIGGRGAYHSSVTITNGSRPALVVRIGSDEEPVEVAFTPGGVPWQPNQADRIFESCIIPGRVLFRIATALRELMPPAIERRTFPATFTVNA
ncbi:MULTISPECIES: hypothetical protein [Hyphomicrobiales]|jgi:hypothetical protein|uniref:hypothetical protein n=1 Tax=Methylobacterium sp. CCH7-A2 TaxID=1768789 RepID=UPI0008295C3A|nr:MULTISPECIES: hypothetical protein [Hyphomicrobiales]